MYTQWISFSRCWNVPNRLTQKHVSPRKRNGVSEWTHCDSIGNWSLGANSFVVDPPNVALVVHDDVEQRQDLAVIELFNPLYDSFANTLSYDMVSENGTSIGGLPGKFGPSTLVIDDDPQPSPIWLGTVSSTLPYLPSTPP
jgi:hypothetical protein